MEAREESSKKRMYVVLSRDVLNGRAAWMMYKWAAIKHPAIQHIITVPAGSDGSRDVIHWR
jgi:hypothetical protein